VLGIQNQTYKMGMVGHTAELVVQKCMCPSVLEAFEVGLVGHTNKLRLQCKEMGSFNEIGIAHKCACVSGVALAVHMHACR